MRVLVVIEAPGKIRTLSTVLSALEIEAEVVATHGHLFDNPESLSPVCINDKLRETRRGPIDQVLIDKIISSAAKCDYVLAATDPDQEGDVIAQDVADLLHGKNVLRAKFHGLDERSVTQGLNNIRPINPPDAWPGSARRILDRLIGAVMIGRFGIPAGRVQSALLGFIAKRPQPFATLHLSVEAADGGDPFVAEVPVTRLNKDVAPEMLERSRLIPPCQAESRTPVLASRPWSYGEILCNVQKRIGGAPRDGMLALQGLYESGSMSYPRASARAVGEDALACLETIADRYDLRRHFVRSRLPKVTEKNAHESPRPLHSGLNLNMPVKLMDYRLATASLVTRNLLMSGIEVIEERPSTAGMPGWAAQLDWKRMVMPPLPWRDPVPAPGIVPIHPDVIAINAMLEAGIGRPSTHCEHAEKFNSRALVDADYAISAKGKEWMASIPETITTFENSSRIERFIESSEMPPEVMISAVIEKLGDQVYAEIRQSLSASSGLE